MTIESYAHSHRRLRPDLAIYLEQLFRRSKFAPYAHKTTSTRVAHSSWWRRHSLVPMWVWQKTIVVSPDFSWSLQHKPIFHILIHEMAHVMQCHRDGGVMMLLRGANETLRKIIGRSDWHDLPFEFEAEAVANELIEHVDMMHVAERFGKDVK